MQLCPGQKEVCGGPALCGPWTCAGGKAPEKSSVPAQNSSELGRPHPGEGLSPSLLRPVPGADHSRAALLVLRLWPRPSTQGRRGEEGEGGGQGGPWRLRGARGGGCRAGHSFSPRPSSLRDLPLSLLSPPRIPQSFSAVSLNTCFSPQASCSGQVCTPQRKRRELLPQKSERGSPDYSGSLLFSFQSGTSRFYSEGWIVMLGGKKKASFLGEIHTHRRPGE